LKRNLHEEVSVISFTRQMIPTYLRMILTYL